MAFIRRVRTPSGATGVQIAEYVGDRRQRIVKYIGSARTAAELGVPALAALVLALALVVPWFAARVVFHIITSDLWVKSAAWFRSRLGLRRQYDPTPNAWDFAYKDWQGGWVRVLMSDGRWVGGFFASKSYASSWPEPHDLFIERGYQLDEDGVFTGQVTAEDGMWVRCDEAAVIDFLPVAADTGVVEEAREDDKA